MNKPTPTQYACILAIIVMVVVALWKNERQETAHMTAGAGILTTGTIQDCSCSCDFNPIINHSEIKRGE